jgi:hypothetical protein
MLCLSSSRPRLSSKTSLPWRSPSIIETRILDIVLKVRRAALNPDARQSKQSGTISGSAIPSGTKRQWGQIPLAQLTRDCHPRIALVC